ncbi:hypothetical protein Maq22A_c28080 [Methylobacterium aquaticum]|uniref:Uncharacterized protein n=1 Tax=Methylobacterium aquaticum TaxID=270351 RepID=A0A1Y0ZC29_9HYPH|nr:hypothetical protein Maq22A_c28080 [Methylobacterium aquaticum]
MAGSCSPPALALLPSERPTDAHDPRRPRTPPRPDRGAGEPPRLHQALPGGCPRGGRRRRRAPRGRPVARRPRRRHRVDQGPVRRAGRGDHRRLVAPSPGRGRARGRADRRPPAPCRRGDRRKDQHVRVRLLGPRPQPALGQPRQCRRSEPGAGRLLVGGGRLGGARHLRHRDRHRYRRIDPHPGRAQRRRRLQAHRPAGAARRGVSALALARFDRPARPLGRGLRRHRRGGGRRGVSPAHGAPVARPADRRAPRPPVHRDRAGGGAGLRGRAVAPERGRRPGARHRLRRPSRPHGRGDGGGPDRRGRGRRDPRRLARRRGRRLRPAGACAHHPRPHRDGGGLYPDDAGPRRADRGRRRAPRAPRRAGPAGDRHHRAADRRGGRGRRRILAPQPADAAQHHGGEPVRPHRHLAAASGSDEAGRPDAARPPRPRPAASRDRRGGRGGLAVTRPGWGRSLRPAILPGPSLAGSSGITARRSGTRAPVPGCGPRCPKRAGQGTSCRA